MITFDQFMGEVIHKAREVDNDTEAKHLAKAAHIVRRDIFSHDNKSFEGSFPANC